MHWFHMDEPLRNKSPFQLYTRLAHKKIRQVTKEPTIQSFLNPESLFCSQPQTHRMCKFLTSSFLSALGAPVLTIQDAQQQWHETRRHLSPIHHIPRVSRQFGADRAAW